MEALSALVQNAPTTSASSTENAQPAVAMFNALYRRVTMIYVLGLFLAGKYRKKVLSSLTYCVLLDAAMYHLCFVYRYFLTRQKTIYVSKYS